MTGELDEFRYAFKQRGLNKDGASFEVQYLPLRALDGVNGRFYQLVLIDMVGKEIFWSFTEPEVLASVLLEFVEMVNQLGEIDAIRISLLQKGLNKIGQEDEQQNLPLMAANGIDGIFYQIVINNEPDNEMGWSFTDPEDLIPMIKKFIEWANKIDDT